MLMLELDELMDRIEARRRACVNLQDEYIKGKHKAYTTAIAEIHEIMERIRKSEVNNNE